MARLILYLLIWSPIALPLAGRAPMPEPGTVHSPDADGFIRTRLKGRPPPLRGDFVPHRPAGRELGQETFWR